MGGGRFMGLTSARRALLTSAAAIGIVSGPAFAIDTVKAATATKPALASTFSPGLSGYFELYGQGLWAHDFYDPWEGFGGAGRLNSWTAPDHSMQYDFSAQS